MKALTIHQPWAWAIAAGHKRVENRTWLTAYRGWLAIHAGSSNKSIADATAFCARQGVTPPPIESLHFGAVIAVATLVDVRPLHTDSLFREEHDKDPWAFGPQCWILDDVRSLSDPVPCSGKMGLFDLPDEVARAVRLQAPPLCQACGMPLQPDDLWGWCSLDCAAELTAESAAVLPQPPLTESDRVGDVTTGIRD